MLPALKTDVPGPLSRVLAEKLRRYESRNVTYVTEDWPIFWQCAEGVNIWDVDGNRFLDLTSAFGVMGLGHTRGELRDALCGQAAKLLHAMGDVHPTELKALLCERLSGMTFEKWGKGIGKVILGNSGFEAVEAALKTALLYSGKPGVLAFHGGYHGLGFGALAVGGIPFFRDPFRRQIKDFATLIPYPGCSCDRDGDFPDCSGGCLLYLRDDLEKAAARREIGAILVEPIQGRGGCVVPPRKFLQMLREVCDTYGILLIADEIMTGFHRTGALFACDHSRVVPDIICVGKALAGGFPLSACVGRSEVMDAWPASSGEALHTSTFLGNPMGCAMALASLKIHEDRSLGKFVEGRGQVFKNALRSLKSPLLGEIRGVGLMMGADVVGRDGRADGALAASLVKRAMKAGLLFLADSPAGNVLSFTPPFAISDEEIANVAEWLGRSLGEGA